MFDFCNSSCTKFKVIALVSKLVGLTKDITENIGLSVPERDKWTTKRYINMHMYY